MGFNSAFKGLIKIITPLNSEIVRLSFKFDLHLAWSCF